MTLPHAIFRSLAALVLFCHQPLGISGEIQDGILVDRTPGGYRLRYQDPDFDDQWREYEVVAADRLIVSSTTTVETYAPGRWLYEYAVANSSESQQEVVSLSVQAAYGTEGFVVAGWDLVKEKNSTFIWKTTQPPGITPAGIASGWSLVSDNLPVVREAQVRGAAAQDTALIDLPAAVRSRIAQLERNNVTRTKILAPGIATRIITIGQEGERDPKDIFAEASQRYPEWLRDAAFTADARRVGLRATTSPASNSSTAWVDRVCERLSQANLVFENSPSAARAYLRDFVRALDNEKVDDGWLESLRHGLIIVVEHVIDRLQ